MRKLVVFLLLFSSSLSLFGQEKYRDLSTENWQFHQEGKSEKYKANVPGTVHTDLLHNQLIPDPFLEDNEAKLQWIENENWVYESSFSLTSKELQHQNIQLQFDGLDTYATVFLNDQIILQANNMFRTWNIDVKKQLRKKRKIYKSQRKRLTNRFLKNPDTALMYYSMLKRLLQSERIQLSCMGYPDGRK